VVRRVLVLAVVHRVLVLVVVRQDQAGVVDR